MIASPTIEIKEYDGGRAVEMQRTADLVFLEAGGHAYAFDAGLFLHAMKRLLAISVILENEDGRPDYALP